MEYPLPWLMRHVAYEVGLYGDRGVPFSKLCLHLSKLVSVDDSLKRFLLDELMKDEHFHLWDSKKGSYVDTGINYAVDYIIVSDPIIQDIALGVTDDMNLSSMNLLILFQVANSRYSGITVGNLRDSTKLAMPKIHYILDALLSWGLIVKASSYDQVHNSQRSSSSRLEFRVLYWIPRFAPRISNRYSSGITTFTPSDCFPEDLYLVEKVLSQVPSLTLPIEDMRSLLGWDEEKCTSVFEYVGALTLGSELRHSGRFNADDALSYIYRGEPPPVSIALPDKYATIALCEEPPLFEACMEGIFGPVNDPYRAGIVSESKDENYVAPIPSVVSNRLRIISLNGANSSGLHYTNPNPANYFSGSNNNMSCFTLLPPSGSSMEKYAFPHSSHLDLSKLSLRVDLLSIEQMLLPRAPYLAMLATDAPFGEWKSNVSLTPEGIFSYAPVHGRPYVGLMGAVFSSMCLTPLSAWASLACSISLVMAIAESSDSALSLNSKEMDARCEIPVFPLRYALSRDSASSFHASVPVGVVAHPRGLGGALRPYVRVRAPLNFRLSPTAATQSLQDHALTLLLLAGRNCVSVRALMQAAQVSRKAAIQALTALEKSGLAVSAGRSIGKQLHNVFSFPGGVAQPLERPALLQVCAEQWLRCELLFALRWGQKRLDELDFGRLPPSSFRNNSAHFTDISGPSADGSSTVSASNNNNSKIPLTGEELEWYFRLQELRRDVVCACLALRPADAALVRVAMANSEACRALSAFEAQVELHALLDANFEARMRQRHLELLALRPSHTNWALHPLASFVGDSSTNSGAKNVWMEFPLEGPSGRLGDPKHLEHLVPLRGIHPEFRGSSTLAKRMLLSASWGQLDISLSYRRTSSIRFTRAAAAAASQSQQQEHHSSASSESSEEENVSLFAGERDFLLAQLRRSARSGEPLQASLLTAAAALVLRNRPPPGKTRDHSIARQRKPLEPWVLALNFPNVRRNKAGEVEMDPLPGAAEPSRTELERLIRASILRRGSLPAVDSSRSSTLNESAGGAHRVREDLGTESGNAELAVKLPEGSPTASSEVYISPNFEQPQSTEGESFKTQEKNEEEKEMEAQRSLEMRAEAARQRLERRRLRALASGEPFDEVLELTKSAYSSSASSRSSSADPLRFSKSSNSEVSKERRGRPKGVRDGEGTGRSSIAYKQQQNQLVGQRPRGRPPKRKYFGKRNAAADSEVVSAEDAEIDPSRVVAVKEVEETEKPVPNELVPDESTIGASARIESSKEEIKNSSAPLDSAALLELRRQRRAARAARALFVDMKPEVGGTIVTKTNDLDLTTNSDFVVPPPLEHSSRRETLSELPRQSRTPVRLASLPIAPSKSISDKSYHKNNIRGNRRSKSAATVSSDSDHSSSSSESASSSVSESDLESDSSVSVGPSSLKKNSKNLKDTPKKESTKKKSISVNSKPISRKDAGAKKDVDAKKKPLTYREVKASLNDAPTLLQSVNTKALNIMRRSAARRAMNKLPYDLSLPFAELSRSTAFQRRQSLLTFLSTVRVASAMELRRFLQGVSDAGGGAMPAAVFQRVRPPMRTREFDSLRAIFPSQWATSPPPRPPSRAPRQTYGVSRGGWRQESLAAINLEHKTLQVDRATAFRAMEYLCAESAGSGAMDVGFRVTAVEVALGDITDRGGNGSGESMTWLYFFQPSSELFGDGEKSEETQLIPLLGGAGPYPDPVIEALDPSQPLLSPEISSIVSPRLSSPKNLKGSDLKEKEKIKEKEQRQRPRDRALIADVPLPASEESPVSLQQDQEEAAATLTTRPRRSRQAVNYAALLGSSSSSDSDSGSDSEGSAGSRRGKRGPASRKKSGDSSSSSASVSEEDDEDEEEDEEVEEADEEEEEVRRRRERARARTQKHRARVRASLNIVSGDKRGNDEVAPTEGEEKVWIPAKNPRPRTETGITSPATSKRSTRNENSSEVVAHINQQVGAVPALSRYTEAALERYRKQQLLNTLAEVWCLGFGLGLSLQQQQSHGTLEDISKLKSTSSSLSVVAVPSVAAATPVSDSVASLQLVGFSAHSRSSGNPPPTNISISDRADESVESEFRLIPFVGQKSAVSGSESVGLFSPRSFQSNPSLNSYEWQSLASPGSEELAHSGRSGVINDPSELVCSIDSYRPKLDQFIRPQNTSAVISHSESSQTLSISDLPWFGRRQALHSHSFLLQPPDSVTFGDLRGALAARANEFFARTHAAAPAQQPSLALAPVSASEMHLENSLSTIENSYGAESSVPANSVLEDRVLVGEALTDILSVPPSISSGTARSITSSVSQRGAKTVPFISTDSEAVLVPRPLVTTALGLLDSTDAVISLPRAHLPGTSVVISRVFSISSDSQDSSGVTVSVRLPRISREPAVPVAAAARPLRRDALTALLRAGAFTQMQVNSPLGTALPLLRRLLFISPSAVCESHEGPLEDPYACTLRASSNEFAWEIQRTIFRALLRRTLLRGSLDTLVTLAPASTSTPSSALLLSSAAAEGVQHVRFGKTDDGLLSLVLLPVLLLANFPLHFGTRWRGAMEGLLLAAGAPARRRRALGGADSDSSSDSHDSGNSDLDSDDSLDENGELRSRRKASATEAQGPRRRQAVPRGVRRGLPIFFAAYHPLHIPTQTNTEPNSQIAPTHSINQGRALEAFVGVQQALARFCRNLGQDASERSVELLSKRAVDVANSLCYSNRIGENGMDRASLATGVVPRAEEWAETVAEFVETSASRALGARAPFAELTAFAERTGKSVRDVVKILMEMASDDEDLHVEDLALGGQSLPSRRLRVSRRLFHEDSFGDFCYDPSTVLYPKDASTTSLSVSEDVQASLPSQSRSVIRNVPGGESALAAASGSDLLIFMGPTDWEQVVETLASELVSAELESSLLAARQWRRFLQELASRWELATAWWRLLGRIAANPSYFHTSEEVDETSPPEQPSKRAKHHPTASRNFESSSFNEFSPHLDEELVKNYREVLEALRSPSPSLNPAGILDYHSFIKLLRSELDLPGLVFSSTSSFASNSMADPALTREEFLLHCAPLLSKTVGELHLPESPTTEAKKLLQSVQVPSQEDTSLPLLHFFGTPLALLDPHFPPSPSITATSTVERTESGELSLFGLLAFMQFPPPLSSDARARRSLESPASVRRVARALGVDAATVELLVRRVRRGTLMRQLGARVSELRARASKFPLLLRPAYGSMFSAPPAADTAPSAADKARLATAALRLPGGLLGLARAMWQVDSSGTDELSSDGYLEDGVMDACVHFSGAGQSLSSRSLLLCVFNVVSLARAEVAESWDLSLTRSPREHLCFPFAGRSSRSTEQLLQQVYIPPSWTSLLDASPIYSALNTVASLVTGSSGPIQRLRTSVAGAVPPPLDDVPAFLEPFYLDFRQLLMKAALRKAAPAWTRVADSFAPPIGLPSILCEVLQAPAGETPLSDHEGADSGFVDNNNREANAGDSGNVTELSPGMLRLSVKAISRAAFALQTALLTSADALESLEGAAGALTHCHSQRELLLGCMGALGGNSNGVYLVSPAADTLLHTSVARIVDSLVASAFTHINQEGIASAPNISTSVKARITARLLADATTLLLARGAFQSNATSTIVSPRPTRDGVSLVSAGFSLRFNHQFRVPSVVRTGAGGGSMSSDSERPFFLDGVLPTSTLPTILASSLLTPAALNTFRAFSAGCVLSDPSPANAGVLDAALTLSALSPVPLQLPEKNTEKRLRDTSIELEDAEVSFWPQELKKARLFHRALSMHWSETSNSHISTGTESTRIANPGASSVSHVLSLAERCRSLFDDSTNHPSNQQPLPLEVDVEEKDPVTSLFRLVLPPFAPPQPRLIRRFQESSSPVTVPEVESMLGPLLKLAFESLKKSLVDLQSSISLTELSYNLITSASSPTSLLARFAATVAVSAAPQSSFFHSTHLPMVCVAVPDPVDMVVGLSSTHLDSPRMHALHALYMLSVPSTMPHAPRSGPSPCHYLLERYFKVDFAESNGNSGLVAVSKCAVLLNMPLLLALVQRLLDALLRNPGASEAMLVHSVPGVPAATLRILLRYCAQGGLIRRDFSLELPSHRPSPELLAELAPLASLKEVKQCEWAHEVAELVSSRGTDPLPFRSLNAFISGLDTFYAELSKTWRPSECDVPEGASQHDLYRRSAELFSDLYSVYPDTYPIFGLVTRYSVKPDYLPQLSALFS